MTNSPTNAGSQPTAGDNNLSIADELREQFGEQLLRAELDAEGTLQVHVAAEALKEVCRFLSEQAEPPYPHLSDAFGADYEDHLQVIYHLFRPGNAEDALVRTDLPRDNAVLPTLTDLYNTASWPEREIAEMFGVTFENHPDPRHLLLPDDWSGYPLRKDYQPPDHPYLCTEPLHEHPATVLQGQPEDQEQPEVELEE